MNSVTEAGVGFCIRAGAYAARGGAAVNGDQLGVGYAEPAAWVVGKRGVRAVGTAVQNADRYSLTFSADADL